MFVAVPLQDAAHMRAYSRKGVQHLIFVFENSDLFSLEVEDSALSRGEFAERFLLGSVAGAVAARAHCSVEIVRKKRSSQRNHNNGNGN